MTVEDTNVNVLKQAYAKWASCKAGEFSCWTDMVSDKFALRSLADGAQEMPFTRQRQGKAQLLEYLNGLTNDWDYISSEVNEFVAQGDRVVAIGRCAWKHKATGKVADSVKIDLWRFRDGKAVEFAEFYDTARAFAAATPST